MKRPLEYCLLVLLMCTPISANATEVQTTLGEDVVTTIRGKLECIEFEFSKCSFEEVDVEFDEASKIYRVKIPQHLEGYLNASAPKKRDSWVKKKFKKLKVNKKNLVRDEDGTPYKSTSLAIFSGVECNEGHVGNQFFFLTALLNCSDFCQIPIERSTMGFYRFLWALEELGMNDFLKECVEDIVFPYAAFTSKDYWGKKIGVDYEFKEASA